MGHTIPERTIAAVQELAGRYPEGRDGSLASHELTVLERARRTLPKLRRAVTEDAASGLHPLLGS